MIIYQVNKQKSYVQSKQKENQRKTKKMKQISSKPFRPITLDDQSIRHTPRDFLRNSNLRKSRDLVRKSTN